MGLCRVPNLSWEALDKLEVVCLQKMGVLGRSFVPPKFSKESTRERFFRFKGEDTNVGLHLHLLPISGV